MRVGVLLRELILVMHFNEPRNFNIWERKHQGCHWGNMEGTDDNYVATAAANVLDSI